MVDSVILLTLHFCYYTVVAMLMQVQFLFFKFFAVVVFVASIKVLDVDSATAPSFKDSLSNGMLCGRLLLLWYCEVRKRSRSKCREWISVVWTRTFQLEL